MAEGLPLIAWEPRSVPQAALVACPIFEVFFGGARGSLKTDSMLGDWLNHAEIYGADAIGLMIRRTREELTETYERAKTIYSRLGFTFNDSKHTCESPDGARLRFAYLERDQDAERYQGHSYTRVYVEEIGNFPTDGPVLKMMATLRSAAGVPVGFRATGNPGGPGHQWVKARYIDPAPQGWEVIEETRTNPFSGKEVVQQRIFIPGKITDHDLLGDSYIAQLQMAGSEALVRAWLLGDWDAVEGAFFSEWDQRKHVLEPFPIPEEWTRFRSMDWGFAAPFSVGWWAIAGDDTAHGEHVIPRGALVRYREWYGASGPGKGIRLTAEEVAQGIKEREEGEGVTYGVLDPSAFAMDGGPSIAERMLREGVSFRPADNKRIARIGAMGGWDQMRARLRGVEGVPMIYCFNTCRDSIRTIPVLQHDPDKAEDLDTDSEDHASDCWRYACMSRPFIRKSKAKPSPDHLFHADADGIIKSTLTISELIKRKTAKRRSQL